MLKRWLSKTNLELEDLDSSDGELCDLIYLGNTVFRILEN